LEYQVSVERLERSPGSYAVERTRDPYLTMVLPCNEVFSWQVRAVDGAENAGPWSQSQIFFLSYSVEGPPRTDIGEVTIVGPFVGEEARRFEASMASFEERTGIDILYEGSTDFETLMLVRVEAGDPPDIAAFSQPGLLSDFVSDGQVLDLNDWFDEGYLEEQYDQHWLDMATMNEIMAGVWYRASVKSLVWYPVPWFQEFGYQIPETWDEMLTLSKQMVGDGNTPWCIGMESGAATGWVATDWMEDIMLRTQPVDAYDAWVNGELPFDSPEVKNAAEIMGEIWFNEDWVLGGTDAILRIYYGDAPTLMFDDPPSCYLHRQASFIPAFFPEDITLGEDVDFFYLPPIEPEEHPKPVLGAGDIFAAFNDRLEVRVVMEYLTTGESTRAWLQSGGFVSPHADTPLDWYPTETDRRYAEILSEASVFRFDGSDLMPSAVGTGSFWSGMVDYVDAEGRNLDEVMKTIDGAWPR
jgi:alpha-glucoside transport system substrate-binding protein